MNNSVKKIYTSESVEFWFKKISVNWESNLNKKWISGGRSLFRTNVIESIELRPGYAIVQAKAGLYTVIEWEKNLPEFKTSSDDVLWGMFLGVSGLYEIESMISELVSPLPEDIISKSRQNFSQKDKKNEQNFDRSRIIISHQKLPDRKNLSLRFFIESNRFGFHIFWEEKNVTSSLQSILDKKSKLESLDREQIVRLMYFAKRQNFRLSKDAFALNDLSAVPDFLTRTLPKWNKYFIIHLPNGIERLKKVREISVKLHAEEFRGNITLRAKIDKNSIANFGNESDIVRYLENQNHVNIPNSWLSDSENVRWVENLGLVVLDKKSVENAKNCEIIWKKGNGQIYLLFSILNSQFANSAENKSQIILNSQLNDWKNSFFREPDQITGFKFLRNYQLYGVSWMKHLLEHGCHPLLADEMGLGKTVQVLTLLSQKLTNKISLNNTESEDVQIKQANIQTAENEDVLQIIKNETSLVYCDVDLVICPASVCSVWAQEAKKFFPKLTVKQDIKNCKFDNFSEDVICEKKSECELWITSYSQARRYKDLLKRIKFRSVILDEAQNIKNSHSKTAMVCFSLESKYRIALTGTPIENSSLDLWSIMHFLMPGLLGSRFNFENTIKHIQTEVLKSQISPFILKRKKAIVAKELPEKVEINLPCVFAEEQSKEYYFWLNQAIDFAKNKSDQKNFLSEEKRMFAKKDENESIKKGRFHFLALLTKLRLICCDPNLLKSNKNTIIQKPQTFSSGKMTVLMEKLSICYAEKTKVVIFSQFVKFLDIINESIKNSWPNWKLWKLTGSSLNREDLISDFQSSEDGIILVSLRAGGTGINLSTANTVFIVDPWWNPAVENQAIDRIHRIGQKKTTFVYRLIAKDSIEDAIQTLKLKKQNLFDSIFMDKNNENWLNEISKLLSQ